MADLAREVLDEACREAGNPEVEVHMEPLPDYHGDPGLLRQVLSNLFSNALKFTRKTAGPRIVVGSLNQDGDHVYFVRDNGAGFDMRHARKLFGVFQRLHSASEFEGTGIGLSIVHRIVQRHGGRIWAEAAINEGATFYFTIGNQEAG
jgi:light-regulated signal transduction histidine kinase (bacteriophytochrome)